MDRTSRSHSVVGGRSFVIAASILLAAALGMNTAIGVLGGVLAKANVPLKKSLNEFPESIGARFELARGFSDDGLEAGKVVLTPDVVETLGTEDYISWFFVDKKRSTPESTAYVRLHMAYYTDLLDAVPHIPENCQVAGGADRDEANDRDPLWTLGRVPKGWEPWKQIQVRQRGFAQTKGDRRIRSVVFYLFSANGEPFHTREGVAASLSSFAKKYCYYMKVEMSAGRTGQPTLDPAEAEAMCRDFFVEAAGDIFQHIASAADIQALEASR